LYLIIVGLVVGEDLADVVNWSLYLVDVPELLPLYYESSGDGFGGGHDI
jgi:hypothetical protein